MKRVSILVLAAAIACGGCLLLAPTTVLAKKGDKYFKQGLQYEAARHWEKAFQEFTLALGADPSNFECQLHLRRASFNASLVYVQQGRALAEQRDYLGAYNAFRQAYEFDSLNKLAVSEMERMLQLQSVKEGTNGSANGNGVKTGERQDSGARSAAQAQEASLPPPRTEQFRVISYSGNLPKGARAQDGGVTLSSTAENEMGAVIPAEKFALPAKATGETAVKRAPAQTVTKPSMEIPRVSRPPKLEDFLDMKPNSEIAGQLAKVEGLIQRNPKDGSPSSQRTEVYLGYDDKNFYSIFVCFDNEPGSIRARMVRREDISGDDAVELMLDTFNDQRRAYAFRSNPFGIQLDALFTEGSKDEDAERPGFDPSYDTLWNSRGKLTDRGYVVWMAIPFRSLRFSSEKMQTWGILLNRDIPRLNEETFWPQYTLSIEGRLNQMATANHLEKISPGRNIQLIPYGLFRTARTLDTLNPELPQFRRRTQVDGGLDAKFGLKDNLVLDVAVNPDFNQVESDEPQVTVTERFEVLFPEKRPFFLENANYFQTPINLVFTRRIADPQFGVRATGKLGPYAVGAFVIDDQAPGKSVLSDHPLHGKRARFGIFRVNRDIFEQSTIGFIFTDREFAKGAAPLGEEDFKALRDRHVGLSSYNRVLGFDGRFKLSQNWVAGFQAVKSWTRFLDGSKSSGSGYNATLNRSGRSLGYEFSYDSFSPGFFTESGFVERTDIHDFKQVVEYRFRPEGKHLISWGPRIATQGVFDHSGLRLDFTQDNSVSFELIGKTEFGVEYNLGRERLRPKDFPVLPENRDFRRKEKSVFFNTSLFDWFTFEGKHRWKTLINFDPPEDHEPFLTNATQSDFLLTLRPRTNLRIDNTYLLTRLHDRFTKANILTNHIIRSKWNYQFSRELSLRVILQYDAVLTNPEFTSEETTKNLNADFLVTYLINPWTALYVGYNNNRQNIALVPTDSGAEIIRRRNQFINDGRQFFIKFSYLFRF
jgi:uncharacterized protein DUF5916